MQKIQAELKAPKSQFNSFGKYKYRSCEDIVEAVKPVLAKYDYYLNMFDEIVAVLDRVYVKATVIVYSNEKIVASSTAFAREEEIKKGMDSSQITGTASSYARKYALNGLFAIDDTKDADSDEHQNVKLSAKPKEKQPITDERLKAAIVKIKAKEYTVEQLTANFELTSEQDKTLLESLLG